jgi:peptidoglycan/xylan/chitin deacetylase (PgdA/CDA1 family)
MTGRAIIMYHAVSTGPDPMSVQVTPERLRSQLGVLRRLGLRGVSMEQLLAAPASTRLVGLTFDDGYADFATTAAPILSEFGFGATVFVVAGAIGAGNDWDPPPRRSLMTRGQVREVHAAGFEVGSHGWSHVRLDQLAARERADQLERSRDALEELLGTRVSGFCYPYGAVDRTTAEAASEVYDYACAIKVRPTTNRWALPRFHVGEGDGSARLVAKLALRPVRERRGASASCV